MGVLVQLTAALTIINKIVVCQKLNDMNKHKFKDNNKDMNNIAKEISWLCAEVQN